MNTHIIDELTGIKTRGIEIVDGTITHDEIIGCPVVIIEAEHHNSDRKPLRSYEFAYRSTGWRCRTRDAPEVCDTVEQYLSKNVDGNELTFD